MTEMRSFPRIFRLVVALTALALLVPAVGCAKTRHARNVETSGFLGDYSQLRAGEGKEALWVFLDQKADWRGFDSFHIESVSLWKSDKRDELTAEEQKAICEYLGQAIHRELSQVIPAAKGPGPKTFVIRAAITEADAANVYLNSVTSIIPQTRLLSTLGGLASDKAVMVGEASIEAEVKDGSGRRIAAAVDRRMGAKTLRNAFSKWGDVEAAFDAWATRFRERLVELRGGPKM